MSTADQEDESGDKKEDETMGKGTVVEEMVIIPGTAGCGFTPSKVKLTRETDVSKFTPAREGIVVVGVRSGSPADHAGMAVGDVIVSVNGISVASMSVIDAVGLTKREVARGSVKLGIIHPYVRTPRSAVTSELGGDPSAVVPVTDTAAQADPVSKTDSPGIVPAATGNITDSEPVDSTAQQHGEEDRDSQRVTTVTVTPAPSDLDSKPLASRSDAIGSDPESELEEPVVASETAPMTKLDTVLELDDSDQLSGSVPGPAQAPAPKKPKGKKLAHAASGTSRKGASRRFFGLSPTKSMLGLSLSSPSSQNSSPLGRSRWNHGLSISIPPLGESPGHKSLLSPDSDAPENYASDPETFAKLRLLSSFWRAVEGLDSESDTEHDSDCNPLSPNNMPRALRLVQMGSTVSKFQKRVRARSNASTPMGGPLSPNWSDASDTPGKGTRTATSPKGQGNWLPKLSLKSVVTSVVEQSQVTARTRAAGSTVAEQAGVGLIALLHRAESRLEMSPTDLEAKSPQHVADGQKGSELEGDQADGEVDSVSSDNESECSHGLKLPTLPPGRGSNMMTSSPTANTMSTLTGSRFRTQASASVKAPPKVLGCSLWC